MQPLRNRAPLHRANEQVSRWCPRSPLGGCRWTGGIDLVAGIGGCVRCEDHSDGARSARSVRGARPTGARATAQHRRSRWLPGTRREVGDCTRGERGTMSRHPLGGALRASEEPPRAAFLAGAEQLGPGCSAFKSKMWVKNAHFGSGFKGLVGGLVRILYSAAPSTFDLRAVEHVNVGHHGPHSPGPF